MGFRVWGYSFGVWGFWGLGADLDPKKPTFFSVPSYDLRFRVWVFLAGFGFRAQGLGCFWGLRFRVWGFWGV